MEVHTYLGAGYLESVYEDALAHELSLRGIQFVRQYAIGIDYKGKIVGEGRIDLFVEDCLVIELKAVETLLPIHRAQVLSYLRATNCQLGLLINFNVVTLKQGGIRRVIYRG